MKTPFQCLDKASFPGTISGLTAGLGAIFLAGWHYPAAATITFNFTTNPQKTSSTRTFTSSGVSLTVDNAQGDNITTAPSFSGITNIGTGGVNTDINNGLCVALYSGPAKCQYSSATLGEITLTGLTFTFDRHVRLIGFDVFRPAGVESGSLSFTTGSLSQTLTFVNVGGLDRPNGQSLGFQSFSPNFVASANTPITVSSLGTVYTPLSSGSFRINNLQVEEVPGPLPVFGAAAAFGWSRRIRKKIKGASAKANES